MPDLHKSVKIRGNFTFQAVDGRPICNYCRKVGHIAFACRKRQADNRDPRIPFQARPRDQNPRTGDERRSLVPTGNQNLN